MNNFDIFKLKCAGLKNHHILNIIAYMRHSTQSLSLSLRNMAVVSKCSDPISFIENYKALKSKELRKIFMEYPSISILDREYPALLKEIHNPPVLFFYQGNIKLLDSPKLAIVGSRKASETGIKSVQKIVEELNNKYVIVSGLARGIDTAAHLSSLRNGGQTIAIIGSGFNNVYPKENRRLQDYIGQHHLLISEYAPNDKPYSFHFPERNRIIAGLVKAVLVVEAKKRSGSLITCQHALDEGRDVYAIPGNIIDGFSDGCNLLIQEGAKCVTNGFQISSELF